MTDSSAYLIEDELTPQARATLMARLFGHRSGDIGLRFVRVPIGASDFTATGVPYTYDDLAPGRSDPRLRHFSIAHDRGYVLPALRSAAQLNRRLYVEGVPWTAPAWMKANDQLDNLGDRGLLRRRDYGPFARYLVRFVKPMTDTACTSTRSPRPTSRSPRRAIPACTCRHRWKRGSCDGSCDRRCAAPSSTRRCSAGTELGPLPTPTR